MHKQIILLSVIFSLLFVVAHANENEYQVDFFNDQRLLFDKYETDSLLIRGQVVNNGVYSAGEISRVELRGNPSLASKVKSNGSFEVEVPSSILRDLKNLNTAIELDFYSKNSQHILTSQATRLALRHEMIDTSKPLAKGQSVTVKGLLEDLYGAKYNLRVRVIQEDEKPVSNWVSVKNGFYEVDAAIEQSGRHYLQVNYLTKGNVLYKAYLLFELSPEDIEADISKELINRGSYNNGLRISITKGDENEDWPLRYIISGEGFICSANLRKNLNTGLSKEIGNDIYSTIVLDTSSTEIDLSGIKPLFGDSIIVRVASEAHIGLHEALDKTYTYENLFELEITGQDNPIYVDKLPSVLMSNREAHLKPDIYVLHSGRIIEKLGNILMTVEGAGISFNRLYNADPLDLFPRASGSAAIRTKVWDVNGNYIGASEEFIKVIGSGPSIDVGQSIILDVKIQNNDENNEKILDIAASSPHNITRIYLNGKMIRFEPSKSVKIAYPIDSSYTESIQVVIMDSDYDLREEVIRLK